MEGKRFDDLTRLVGRGASRRSILKGLLGLGAAAAAGTLTGDGVDARTLRTRPRITTSPPPQPTTTSTTPAPLCDGDEDQCPGSTVCCPTGTCARSGNQAICCDGTNGNGDVPCGLDCCDDPYQCCDLECCGDDAVCLVRVFGGETELIKEEVCCPAEQTCDGQCCDGECYVAEGFPLAFSGFPFDVQLAERTCCPAGNSVCQGYDNADCCDDATEECCLDASGVATCIPIGGCCTDEACEDTCEFCDPEASTCVNRCADDPEGSFCCPSEGPGGYVCLEFGECCPGDGNCGDCGTCQNGSCSALGGSCQLCQRCGESSPGVFDCEPDPTQAGDLCEQCKVCDDSGGCTVNADDLTECSFFNGGICCSGACTDPAIGCTTTTTSAGPATTTTTGDPASTTTTTGDPGSSTTDPPCNPTECAAQTFCEGNSAWHSFSCQGDVCQERITSCLDLDPCTTNTCNAENGCVSEPVDSCNPEFGVVCCPPGWFCPAGPVGEPRGCACDGRVCNDGSCAFCCTAADCASELSGEEPCMICDGTCSFKTPGTPCTGGSCPTGSNCTCTLGGACVAPN